MQIEESPLFVKTCVGVIKTLVQLMIRNKKTSIRLSQLGIVSLDKKKKKLIIRLNCIESKVEDCIKSGELLDDSRA